MMILTLFDYTFGGPQQDFELVDVDIDLGSVRVSDIQWPLRHGSRPGVDYLESGSLSFTAVTTYGINDEEEGDRALGKFLSAWRRGLTQGPGALVPLYITTGKQRVVYGRPRRLDPPVPGSGNAEAGIMEFTAQFIIHDPLVYSTESVSLPISVIPRSLGGIVAPLVTPITTTMTSGVEYRFLKVEGDAPAPVKITFHGPAKDPVVQVGGVKVGIRGSILYDEEIIVDGRTKEVTFQDGRQASARLTKDSRTSKLFVSPGTHEISFTATDRTGTAGVTVEATPAYYHV